MPIEEIEARQAEANRIAGEIVDSLEQFFPSYNKPTWTHRRSSGTNGAWNFIRLEAQLRTHSFDRPNLLKSINWKEQTIDDDDQSLTIRGHANGVRLELEIAWEKQPEETS